VGMTIPDSPASSVESGQVKVADQSFETNGAGDSAASCHQQ
jgi:hypothetical protein